MTNEEIRQENMQRIINAGIQCFMRDGIANTQIVSIAEKSGLSKRSFLRYFGSKDNFVLEVLKNVNVTCYRQGCACYREITQQYACATQRLRALMLATRDFFFAHTEVFVLLSEGQSYVKNSPEREHILEQYTLLSDFWPSVVLDLMKQGVVEGSITCFPPEYVQKNESNALWYAYIGLLVQMAYAAMLGNSSESDCRETINRFIEQSLQSLLYQPTRQA